MSETPFDILVAGEINPDLILTGDVNPEFDQVEKTVDSAALTIGSSSAIFACGAARLGLRVAFIGVCSEDVFGRFMLAEMQKRSVDVSNVIIRGGQTGLTVILSKGVDRAILTYPGLIGELQSSDLPDGLLSQARHLHVASYFLQKRLQAGLPALFRQARKLGLTTSLDTNYDPTGLWADFDDLLSVTNVFLPNEKEALSISRKHHLDQAATWLGSRVDALAVKLGAAGALGVSASRRIRAASIPVQVADTVGAGDSFDAGFLYGYLHQWELERSLRLACVCGALSTQKPGGTDGQPTLEEAMIYVS
ncbi:MAG TPA: sugar kinase [Longilinea sp.]|nr:sugar kinase [Longilinea sp.]